MIVPLSWIPSFFLTNPPTLAPIDRRCVLLPVFIPDAVRPVFRALNAPPTAAPALRANDGFGPLSRLINFAIGGLGAVPAGLGVMGAFPGPFAGFAFMWASIRAVILPASLVVALYIASLRDAHFAVGGFAPGLFPLAGEIVAAGVFFPACGVV